MPRKASTVTEPRAEQYDFKQSLIRTGYGHLPDDLRTKALAQVNVQKAHLAQGFGLYHRGWLQCVERVLAPAVSQGSIFKLDYAKYKAFINEYMSKVAGKGSETADMVVAKFTRLGCDAGTLSAIIAVLGEVTAA